MRHSERHHRAEHHRKRRGGKDDVLRPGAAQEFTAEAEVHQTHHGKRAGLDHRHRVQQGRDRGRGHRRRGQPAVEGEDRRLDAEAEECQDEDRHKLLFVARNLVHVQNAAVGEGEGVGVAAEVHEADEHQRRAGHGVEDVLFARAPRLVVHLVHDEREGHQGHELIAEVEGEEICRVGDARHDAEGDDKEAEEEVFPPLVRHVGEGVERGHGPEHADDAAEDQRNAVGPEGDREHGAEVGDMHRHAVRAVDRRKQGRAEDENGVDAHDRDRIAVADFPVLRPPDKERRTREDGEEHA